MFALFGGIICLGVLGVNFGFWGGFWDLGLEKDNDVVEEYPGMPVCP